MTEHGKAVKRFFKQLAPQYGRKYSEASPYLQYLFSNRLNLATQPYALSSKRILDIGAGTGPLYDWLAVHDSSRSNYLALDPVQEMKHWSKVPAAQYIVGDHRALDVLGDPFDFVFMLGVHAYLQPAEWYEYLDKVQRLLSENGRLILECSNADNLENQLLRRIKPIVRKLPSPNRVAAQPFTTQTATPAQIRKALAQVGFSVERIDYLPATVPFLQHLHPKLAVQLSRQLSKNSGLPAFIRGDFVVHAYKH